MYALRLARAFTGRYKIVKFEGQYHGWSDEEKVSIDADTVADLGPRENPRKILPTKGQRLSSADDLILLPWNDLEALDRTLTQRREEIAAVLRETNVLVLSDEIYSELTYGLDRHVSIASLPGMAERTIVVNGFSKSYAMTGWRLGYAAGPAPLVKVMTKIHQSCIMSAPTTSQYAAITALRQCDDQIEMMRDEYNRRRRYVVKALNDMGLTCFEPRGAFYVFPSIQISGLTSSEFCEQLLREKEVAIIPGSAFGASGEGYARISYAYSVDHLQTAMKRIREFLTEHGWMKK